MDVWFLKGLNKEVLKKDYVAEEKVQLFRSLELKIAISLCF